jgi:alkanesulfonate monooxygenase SsuD/methylene tetrahydromethanopterin reductase-like flavin-dependent oxidoreductase (luciferase family)
MEEDYQWAGILYDRPSLRIERLDEALMIIRGMWADEATSFSGRHYQVNDIPLGLGLGEGSAPDILIGGGGRKLLTVAGRHADIVGINPKIPEGRITPETALDLAPERVQQKIDWVRAGAEAAGRNFDDIELNSLVFVTAVTDDPAPVYEMVSANLGVPADQVAELPLFLVGSANAIMDTLQKRREQTGISYIVVQGADMAQLELFAERVVAPLAGR